MNYIEIGLVSNAIVKFLDLPVQHQLGLEQQYKRKEKKDDKVESMK